MNSDAGVYSPTEDLTLREAVFRMHEGLGGVVFSLNNFCKCNGRWKSNKWKTSTYQSRA